MPGRTPDWTPLMDSRAQQLVGKGLTAKIAAIILGRELGYRVTRNAILGRLHRLPDYKPRPRHKSEHPRHLSEAQRESNNAHARARYAAKAPTSVLPPAIPRHTPPVAKPAYVGEPKLITELPNGKGCRFAVTDDRPFRFCGGEGYPWCEFHRAVVYYHG